MYAYFTLEGFERQFGRKELMRIQNLEKLKQKVTCECGATLTYGHLSHHRLYSIKHSKAMGLPYKHLGHMMWLREEDD